MTTKTQIRKAVAAAVSALTAEVREEAALDLAARVGAMPDLAARAGALLGPTTCVGAMLDLAACTDTMPDKQPAGCAAAFMPMPDEIDTLPLVDRLLAAGWKVVIPKVEGDQMEFYPYSTESLSCGAWGILEPELPAAPVSASEIDVMIVPGRAFTQAGDRLGRGKGFYDRYMSRDGFRARKIGVCFKCQLVEVLPTEPHDMKVDEVVSC